MHRFTPIFPLLFLLAAATPGFAQSITGRVIGVYDGDSLTLLTAEKRQVKIRLFGIDAPELRQPFGARAKQHLSGLVFGKTVRAEVRDIDRYGRTVADVIVGGVNVNQAMAAAGWAWWYVEYARKDAKLAALEQAARTARRGLWADAKPIPPWEWRKKQ